MNMERRLEALEAALLPPEDALRHIAICYVAHARRSDPINFATHKGKHWTRCCDEAEGLFVERVWRDIDIEHGTTLPQVAYFTEDDLEAVRC